jgi:voltage-gated sodium channel
VRAAQRIVDSTWFNVAIVLVILGNAALLGLGTFPQLAGMQQLLDRLEAAILGIFIAELAVRFAAHGSRPQDFFRDGWNVFDFIVVAAAFVPGWRANSTLLRMLRIARVVRVVRFFPALRLIVAGVVRSLPGVAGFLVMAVVTLYVYGMLGWLLFAETDPEQFGNVGVAVLTLFVLLSLENLPTLIEAGLEVSPWSLVYFISYVLIASYLLVNVLVGVVINSMEETRQAERDARLRHDYHLDAAAPPEAIDRLTLAQRLDDLRAAVVALERELRIDRDRDDGAGRDGDAGRDDDSGRDGNSGRDGDRAP